LEWWNIGMMEQWGPGQWDNGLLGKFHLIRKVSALIKQELPFETHPNKYGIFDIPSFQYSIIPCAWQKH
jgi:hypothetical protein